MAAVPTARVSPRWKEPSRWNSPLAPPDLFASWLFALDTRSLLHLADPTASPPTRPLRLAGGRRAETREPSCVCGGASRLRERADGATDGPMFRAYRGDRYEVSRLVPPPRDPTALG